MTKKRIIIILLIILALISVVFLYRLNRDAFQLNESDLKSDAISRTSGYYVNVVTALKVIDTDKSDNGIITIYNATMDTGEEVRIVMVYHKSFILDKYQWAGYTEISDNGAVESLDVQGFMRDIEYEVTYDKLTAVRHYINSRSRDALFSIVLAIISILIIRFRVMLEVKNDEKKRDC